MPQQVLRKSFDKGALWRFKGWLKVGRLCARRQETLPRLTRFEGNFQTFGLICKLTVVLASQVLMCDLSLATGGCMQGKEAWDMMMASSICINIHTSCTYMSCVVVLWQRWTCLRRYLKYSFEDILKCHKVIHHFRQVINYLSDLSSNFFL